MKKQIATRNLYFIVEVARNYDNHLPTNFLAAWFNHKRQSRGVLHTNKESIVHNLRLIMPGVDKNGALKTWAHFDLDEG